eukprot:15361259-Ditylum_brightwellii.AAC.1
MVKKCFFNVVKSGVRELQFGRCILVACLGKPRIKLGDFVGHGVGLDSIFCKDSLLAIMVELSFDK